MGLILTDKLERFIQTAVERKDISPVDVQPLKSCVKRADINHDGTVDTDEWRTFKQRLQPSERAAMGKARYFQELDRYLDLNSLKSQITDIP